MLIFGFATLLSCLLVPFSFFLLLLVIKAYRALHTQALAPASQQPFILFVIPAHNEAANIGQTIHSLRACAYPKERFQIAVIADNCSDNTASVCRDLGCIVLERQHASDRGKGFALAYSFHTLQQDAALTHVDAFAVIDADTVVDPNLLQVFANYLQAGRDWIQAYYLPSNPDISWRTQLMTYGLSLFNGIYMLGMQQLGLSVQLRGNGMCFRRTALKRCPWRAFTLAEDLEFGWWLRLSQEKVTFAHETRVYGEVVSSGGRAAKIQRQRWEIGRSSLKKQFAAPLRTCQLSKRDRYFYFIDLYMPALAKLMAANIFCSALFVVSHKFETTPLCFLTVALITLWLPPLIYLLSPFVLLGLPLRYLRALAFAPFYMLWKFGLSFANKPTHWIRTPRAGDKKT